MSMNLHDLVRGAVTTVNEDEDGTVYIATGWTNTQGILTPSFAPVAARLQVQAKQHTALELSTDRGLAYQNSLFTVYAYGNFSDLDRPDGKGGDLVRMRDTWWRITQVLEWWPGWSSFEVTRQLNGATLPDLLAQLKNGGAP